MEASVTEIHLHPLRPDGFVEPLFPTPASKREIVKHLLDAPWLARGSELVGRNGEAARVSWEPVRLEHRDGRTTVVRSGCGRRSPWRRRRVVEVLDRWREVRGWWDGNGVDRAHFRVSLVGGPVVDLALEKAGGWYLAGVVD